MTTYDDLVVKAPDLLCATMPRDYGWLNECLFWRHRQRKHRGDHPHTHKIFIKLLQPQLPPPISFPTQQSKRQKRSNRLLQIYPVLGCLFLTACLCIGQSQLHVFLSTELWLLQHKCCKPHVSHPAAWDKRASVIQADRRPLHNNNERCWRHTELRHMQNTHILSLSLSLSVNMCVCTFLSYIHAHKQKHT